MFTGNAFPGLALNIAVSFGLLGTPFDQFPGSSQSPPEGLIQVVVVVAAGEVEA